MRAVVAADAAAAEAGARRASDDGDEPTPLHARLEHAESDAHQGSSGCCDGHTHAGAFRPRFRAARATPVPKAASEAFFRALADNDQKALQTVLGNDWRRFVPAGEVDREDIYDFLGAWAKQHKVVLDTARPRRCWGRATVTGPCRSRSSRARPAGTSTRAPAPTQMQHAPHRAQRAGRHAGRARATSMPSGSTRRWTATATACSSTPRSSPARRASTTACTGPTGPGEDGESAGPALRPGPEAGEGYHGYHFKILKAQGPERTRRRLRLRHRQSHARRLRAGRLAVSATARPA